MSALPINVRKILVVKVRYLHILALISNLIKLLARLVVPNKKKDFLLRLCLALQNVSVS